MTDTEIYFPPIDRGVKLPKVANKENGVSQNVKVYCEGCKHYIKIHGSDWCDIEEKWNGDFTFFPENKNANHDCKDYEPKDREPERCPRP